MSRNIFNSNWTLAFDGHWGSWRDSPNSRLNCRDPNFDWKIRDGPLDKKFPEVSASLCEILAWHENAKSLQKFNLSGLCALVGN